MGNLFGRTQRSSPNVSGEKANHEHATQAHVLHKTIICQLQSGIEKGWFLHHF